MNHSLLTADRSTHIKIVTLALVFGCMLVLGGGAARLADPDKIAARAASGPIIKASRTTAYTGRRISVTR